MPDPKKKKICKKFLRFNKDRRERNHPLNYAKFPNNPVKRTNFYSRIYISKGEKKMQSGINKFPPLSLRKKSASNRSTNYRCKGQWQIQRLEKKKKRGGGESTRRVDFSLRCSTNNNNFHGSSRQTEAKPASRGVHYAAI